MKGVVLLSGGLDSAVTAATARTQGFEVYALTVRYGQRHVVEVAAAQKLAPHLGVFRHVVVDVDLRGIAPSALTGDTPVPTRRDPAAIGHDIPPTYVPARNTILLGLALAWAESLQAQDVFIGANTLDYSGYPDCRPEFLRAFERMAHLATKAGVQGCSRFAIHAPFLMCSKAEIVLRGIALGVDLGMTTSCYAPTVDGAACAVCDACVLRRKAFAEAGVPDPTRYVPPAGGS